MLTCLDQQNDIFLAIVAGDAVWVEQLVNSGADLQTQDHEGLIPICRAIRNGESSIASLLLKHAGTLVPIAPVTPPLYWKAFRVLMKCASVVLSMLFNLVVWYWLHKLCRPLREFDLHLQQSRPILFTVFFHVRTHLHMRFYKYVYQSLYQYLQKQPYIIRPKPALRIDTAGLTFTAVYILEEVVRYGGDMESFMLELLDSGFPLGNPNRPSGPAASILLWAAEKGHLRVLQRLVKAGVDVDVTR